MVTRSVNQYQKSSEELATLVISIKKSHCINPGSCKQNFNLTKTCPYSWMLQSQPIKLKVFWFLPALTIFICATISERTVGGLLPSVGETRTGAKPLGFSGPTKSSTFQAVRLVMAFKSNWAFWINMRVTVTSDLRASIKRSFW